MEALCLPAMEGLLEPYPLTYPQKLWITGCVNNLTVGRCKQDTFCITDEPRNDRR